MSASNTKIKNTSIIEDLKNGAVYAVAGILGFIAGVGASVALMAALAIGSVLSVFATMFFMLKNDPAVLQKLYSKMVGFSTNTKIFLGKMQANAQDTTRGILSWFDDKRAGVEENLGIKNEDKKTNNTFVNNAANLFEQMIHITSELGYLCSMAIIYTPVLLSKKNAEESVQSKNGKETFFRMFNIFASIRDVVNDHERILSKEKEGVEEGFLEIRNKLKQ